MSKKILIVDDQVNFTHIIKMIIESQGFEGLTASNGQEAIDKMKDALPDLILLDLMMPEMTGFEVLEEIKDKSKFQKIPVIVISALAEKKYVDRAYNLGAVDYIVKDFDPDELLSSIKENL